MKKILLDTNAYTYLLTGDQRVLDVLGAAETVYMSVFVLGELYSGFFGGSKEKENKSILGRFLEKPSVKILNATDETAAIFGMIKNNLRSKGTPLPINDVWIAAHGMETGATVITFDPHFKRVSGLILWDLV